MGQQYLGEIRLFPYFAGVPKNWRLCNGAILPVAQYTALFSLIRNYYGGDGKTTFALPDLRGRAPIHFMPNTIGISMGSETSTLTIPTLPGHTHPFNASGADGTVSANNGNFLADTSPVNIFASTLGAITTLSPGSIVPTGAGQAHANMQPYLVLEYCIAMEGVFPSS